MKPDGDATHVLTRWAAGEQAVALTVVTGSRTSNRLLRAKELALEVGKTPVEVVAAYGHKAELKFWARYAWPNVEVRSVTNPEALKAVPVRVFVDAHRMRQCDILPALRPDATVILTCAEPSTTSAEWLQNVMRLSCVRVIRLGEDADAATLGK